jgi:hypothetical protein
MVSSRLIRPLLIPSKLGQNRPYSKPNGPLINLTRPSTPLMRGESIAIPCSTIQMTCPRAYPSLIHAKTSHSHHHGKIPAIYEIQIRSSFLQIPGMSERVLQILAVELQIINFHLFSVFCISIPRPCIQSIRSDRIGLGLGR